MCVCERDMRQEKEREGTRRNEKEREEKKRREQHSKDVKEEMDGMDCQ